MSLANTIYQAKYRASSKGREARRKYRKSRKGRECKKRYSRTEKGKVVRRRGVAKYQASPKGKLARQKYYSSPKGIAYQARKSANRRKHKSVMLINDLTAEQWVAILEQHDYRCHYCQQAKKLTMDHVVPISKGGNHTASNIVPACTFCNSSKGSRLLPSQCSIH